MNWHHDLITHCLQDLNSSPGDLRSEVIVEGVRPQDHLWLPLVAWASVPKSVLKRLRSKNRNPALRGDACQSLCNVSQKRRLRNKIGYARSMCRNTRPPRD